jgi:predicted nucleotidyltransferase
MDNLAQAPLQFGLSNQILASLRQVLGHFPEVEKAVIYGSRATGSYRSYSDIDIAVMAPTMTDREFSHLWNALDDLPILFKLDAVHFERMTNPRLRENILNEGVAIYPAR